MVISWFVQLIIGNADIFLDYIRKIFYITYRFIFKSETYHYKDLVSHLEAHWNHLGASRNTEAWVPLPEILTGLVWGVAQALGVLQSLHMVPLCSQTEKHWCIATFCESWDLERLIDLPHVTQLVSDNGQKPAFWLSDQCSSHPTGVFQSWLIHKPFALSFNIFL